MTRPAPRPSLAHSDWLPKHLLIDDGAIVGVIDWERAGSASPAFDLARWEVSARDPLHHRSDLLRRGYVRVADPDSADAGWVPAFAIDWALEVLGWKNPATPALDQLEVHSPSGPLGLGNRSDFREHSRAACCAAPRCALTANRVGVRCK